MRSRYTAFVRCDEPYLLATWHPETRPSRVRFEERQRWLGLKIRSTGAGREGDATGTVEFVARFKIDGRGGRLHEVSRFELIGSKWYYLDGEHRWSAEPGAGCAALTNTYMIGLQSGVKSNNRRCGALSFGE